MTTDVVDFVPTLRVDFVRSRIGDECVVWSPVAAVPTTLDALAALMLDVVDGSASIGQLATEVHEEIGIPLDAAQRRVREIVDVYDRACLLTSSPGASSAAIRAIAQREVFIAAPTPCSENASRLGTATLVLRFGDQTIRVACDSRRGARMLRAALADHVVEGGDEVPLAFVLTAPQGFRRTHELVDRAGLVLSEGRGLEAGLHALASHLTAFLPPAPGTVRIRARGVVAGGRTIVCLDPVLYVPALDEQDLARAGLGVVDRLALDVDVRTGRIANPEIPWPALAALSAGPAHSGTNATAGGVPVAAVCSYATDTPAAVVTKLAANGLHGSAAELVQAATSLVAQAKLRSAPTAADEIVELLHELGSENR